MLQLLIYSVLARQARSAVFLVGGALVAVMALGQLAESVNGLMLVVLAVDVVLLLALLAGAARHNRRAAQASPQVSPQDGSVGGSVPAAPGADGDVKGHGQLRG
jgi:hypothetical protein